MNPRELRDGKRPVLVHVGRASGATYETPLEIIEIDGGFVVLLVYGPESDWVKNTLASGTATVRLKGQQIPVENPRIVDLTQVEPLLPDDAKGAPSFMKVTQCLRMDRSTAGNAG